MIDPPRRIAAAVAGAGVVLCVLGWYQISGQPTVPQQLPYLASATIPGAALLVVGLVLLLRGPSPGSAARSYAVRWMHGPAASPPPSSTALVRVPDGRYLHTPECPLLDGRTDVTPVGSGEEPSAPLRRCPLCLPTTTVAADAAAATTTDTATAAAGTTGADTADTAAGTTGADTADGSAESRD